MGTRLQPLFLGLQVQFFQLRVRESQEIRKSLLIVLLEVTYYDSVIGR